MAKSNTTLWKEESLWVKTPNKRQGSFFFLFQRNFHGVRHIIIFATKKKDSRKFFRLWPHHWPLTLIVQRPVLQLHTYVKIFIESWKSPLLNFPMVFRVKRAKKFVKRVWVVVEGKNMKEIPSLHVKILLSNVIKMREICMLWGLASKWQTSQDFPTFKNNL